jgi:hypothetical protein
MADAAKAGAGPKAGGDAPSEGGAAKPATQPQGGAAKPATKQPEGEAARVEGLQGRLARLERMVGIRTRVGLVLLAIGIGCAAAAAYLAIDTREDSASEEELRELRSELERTTGAGGAETAAVQAELERLRERIQGLAAEQAALERAAAEATRGTGDAAGTGQSTQEGAGEGEAGPDAGAGGAAEGGASKGRGGAVSTGQGE